VGRATSRRVLLLTLAAGALVAVFVVRWLAESPNEIARSDFAPLQVAGVIVRSGNAALLYDPVRQAQVYAVVTQANHPGTLFFIHAPVAAILLVPFSLAGLDGAFRAWGLAQLLCLVAAAVIAARSAPPARHGGALTALASGVALAVPSTMLMLLEGQDVGVPALLLACAYLAMRRRRPGLAGAALAVAALAGKPHLFLGLAIWIVFWGDRRLVAGALAGAAATTAASLAVVGPAGVAGFVSALVSGRSDFPNSQESVAGLFRAWTGGGLKATVPTALATLAALVAVAVASRRGGAGRMPLEASLAIATVLSLLCAPHLYPHDMALLVPVFAWMTVVSVAPLTARAAGRDATAATTLVAVWAAFTACLAVDSAGALPAAAGSLGPFALAAAALTVWLCSARTRRETEAVATAPG
jgi:Glycosyltransferase family 87